MEGQQEAIQGSGFKDRTVGLVVFGILEILLGGLCLLMVPLMLVSMILSSQSASAPPVSVKMAMPSVLFYLLLGMWFICMGIGSIRARRWARALTLVMSWTWLIGGIASFIAVLMLLPDIYDRMAQDGQVPQVIATIMKYIMAGFMAVFYIVIPGVLVLFYGSKNVKATCELKDPQLRWTDKCPLPVLALSLIYAFWAVSLLLMGSYGWTIPFFGTLLGGAAGALVVLVSIALFAYAAWGMYRLDIKGWWCAFVMMVAWIVSAGITFTRVTLFEFYERMNFPEQQLEMIKQYNIDITRNPTMVMFFWIGFVGFMGYLLYTRRYFISATPQEDSSYDN